MCLEVHAKNNNSSSSNREEKKKELNKLGEIIVLQTFHGIMDINFIYFARINWMNKFHRNNIKNGRVLCGDGWMDGWIKWAKCARQVYFSIIYNSRRHHHHHWLCICVQQMYESEQYRVSRSFIGAESEWLAPCMNKISFSYKLIPFGWVTARYNCHCSLKLVLVAFLHFPIPSILFPLEPQPMSFHSVSDFLLLNRILVQTIQTCTDIIIVFQ